MTVVIPQRDLRNQNAAIIAAVAAGETFVVTRNGAPVAELRPITARRRTFLPKAEVTAVAANSGHVDADAFRGDLDTVINPAL